MQSTVMDELVLMGIYRLCPRTKEPDHSCSGCEGEALAEGTYVDG